MESSGPFEIEFNAMCTIKIKAREGLFGNQVTVHPDLTEEQRKLVQKYDSDNKLCVPIPDSEVRDLTEKEVERYLSDMSSSGINVPDVKDAMLILRAYKEMSALDPKIAQRRTVSTQLAIIEKPRRWARILKLIDVEAYQRYKNKYNLNV